MIVNPLLHKGNGQSSRFMDEDNEIKGDVAETIE